jgi:hypothetical protein
MTFTPEVRPAPPQGGPLSAALEVLARHGLSLPPSTTEANRIERLRIAGHAVAGAAKTACLTMKKTRPTAPRLPGAVKLAIMAISATSGDRPGHPGGTRSRAEGDSRSAAGKVWQQRTARAPTAPEGIHGKPSGVSVLRALGTSACARMSR